MSAPEDRETVSGTNLRSENKYDTRDGLVEIRESFVIYIRIFIRSIF